MDRNYEKLLSTALTSLEAIFESGVEQGSDEAKKINAEALALTRKINDKLAKNNISGESKLTKEDYPHLILLTNLAVDIFTRRASDYEKLAKSYKYLIEMLVRVYNSGKEKNDSEFHEIEDKILKVEDK